MNSLRYRHPEGTKVEKLLIASKSYSYANRDLLAGTLVLPSVMNSTISASEYTISNSVISLSIVEMCVGTTKSSSSQALCMCLMLPKHLRFWLLHVLHLNSYLRFRNFNSGYSSFMKSTFYRYHLQQLLQYSYRFGEISILPIHREVQGDYSRYNNRN